jgi:hypothetical protein
MFYSITPTTQATDIFDLYLGISFFFKPVYNLPGYFRIVQRLKNVTFVAVQATNCNHLVLLLHSYLLLLLDAAISYNVCGHTATA